MENDQPAPQGLAAVIEKENEARRREVLEMLARFSETAGRWSITYAGPGSWMADAAVKSHFMFRIESDARDEMALFFVRSENLPDLIAEIVARIATPASAIVALEELLKRLPDGARSLALKAVMAWAIESLFSKAGEQPERVRAVLRKIESVADQVSAVVADMFDDEPPFGAPREPH